jgi:hypothetical protein
VAAIPLPIQESVRDLLAGLLGRSVAVAKAGELDLDSQPGVVGLYVTGDDTVSVVALGDVGFACRPARFRRHHRRLRRRPVLAAHDVKVGAPPAKVTCMTWSRRRLG